MLPSLFLTVTSNSFLIYNPNPNPLTLTLCWYISRYLRSRYQYCTENWIKVPLVPLRLLYLSGWANKVSSECRWCWGNRGWFKAEIINWLINYWIDRDIMRNYFLKISFLIEWETLLSALSTCAHFLKINYRRIHLGLALRGDLE